MWPPFPFKTLQNIKSIWSKKCKEIKAEAQNEDMKTSLENGHIFCCSFLIETVWNMMTSSVTRKALIITQDPDHPLHQHVTPPAPLAVAMD